MKFYYQNTRFYVYMLSLFVATSFVSCGTHQTVAGSDGIYDDATPPVHKKRQVAVSTPQTRTEQNENYFTQELKRLDELNGTDIITDIESYRSETYEDEAVDEQYNTASTEYRQPWGYNNHQSDVVVHINTVPRWGFYNDWYWNDPYLNWRWNRWHYYRWGYTPYWHPYYHWNTGFYIGYNRYYPRYFHPYNSYRRYNRWNNCYYGNRHYRPSRGANFYRKGYSSRSPSKGYSKRPEAQSRRHPSRAYDRRPTRTRSVKRSTPKTSSRKRNAVETTRRVVRSNAKGNRSKATRNTETRKNHQSKRRTQPDTRTKSYKPTRSSKTPSRVSTPPSRGWYSNKNGRSRRYVRSKRYN